MSAILNQYLRGDLVGVGFETDYGGVRVHIIAWENAQYERLRDHPIFTDGLIIDQIEFGVKSKTLDAKIEVLEPVVVADLVPPVAPIEIIAEPVIEVSQVAVPVTEWHVNPETIVVDNTLPIVTEPAAPVGAVDGFPDVIATHETIEPAISETPVEPIQEPVVVAVSELTASPPAQVLDTPVAVEQSAPVAEAIPEVNVESTPNASPEVVDEVIDDVAEEAWKPTPGDSESKTIQSYLKQFGIATPHKQVIDALAAFGIEVTSSQVLMAKKAIKQ